jgi:hypothetical protein
VARLKTETSGYGWQAVESAIKPPESALRNLSISQSNYVLLVGTSKTSEKGYITETLGKRYTKET